MHAHPSMKHAGSLLIIATLALRVFLIIVVLAVALAPGAHAQIGVDPLLRAMQDELGRSINKLQLEDLAPPYYIQYVVEDVEAFEIVASFGAVVRSSTGRRRQLRIDVRVGSYEFDNSAFVSSRSFQFGGTMFPTPLVIEDDYDALRHDLWLATDRAYKDALEELAGKRAFMKNQVRDDNIPDFSRSVPVKMTEGRASLEFDGSKWREIIRSLSAVFRDYPTIQESSVHMRIQIGTRYYVNSEGSAFRLPETTLLLYARAGAHAGDGMKLKNYISFFSFEPDGLPPEKALTSAITEMAGELEALTRAPVADEYIGPVLITAPCAGALLGQLLAPELSGSRPPMTEIPQMAAMYSASKLAGRIGRKVLPTFLSVIDDPGTREYEGEDLIGSYKIDDEGVRAERVVLVDDGILQTLLTSRRPMKDMATSNGHARGSAMGGIDVVIGNLLITTSNPVGVDELKAQLLERCRDEGLDYGIIIRKLDDPQFTGQEAASSMMALMSGDVTGSITSPILAYRVSVEDGSERLVRGFSIENLGLRALRDIVAASYDYDVHNFVMLGGGPVGRMMTLFSGRSNAGPAGILASVVAPSMLLEEVEFKLENTTQEKPALLTHPYWGKE